MKGGTENKIKLGTKDYPRLLAQITDPPAALYCRGNIDLLHSNCLGVVGTRKITPYGKEAAHYISAGLSKNGFTIVSGLAMGIDAVAHSATLENDGPTIAVFGTGVDDPLIHPRVNFKLAQDILKKGGLLISEYEDGTPGAKHTFPARNRIISGLSLGVIIIEADAKSGALITAQCALDQNRDVFAVPGNIFSPRSAGPNILLRQGAKLVMSPQDVIDEYSSQPAIIALNKNAISTKDADEEIILAILDENGPSHIDEIIKISLQPAPQIISKISILEIYGKIKHIGNGIYKKS